MKTSYAFAALLLTAVGCSSQAGKTPAISDPTPGDPAVGSVTFRATFPGAAAPSLIDPATSSIALSWDATNASTTGAATLTPASPTKTVKLPVGEYLFTANAKDSSGAVIETAGTAGKVIGGENAVVITFLNGKWLFKDGTGANSPIELLATKSDGSAPLVVDGFYLWNQANTIGTAALTLDPSIAIRANGYDLTFITNDTLTPNKGTPTEIDSQFGGGAANLAIIREASYNLTLNCHGGDNGCNTDGPGDVGNRWIMIQGTPPTNGGGSDSDRAIRSLMPQQVFPPDMVQYFDARVVDGTTIQGHLFELSVKAETHAIVTNQGPIVSGAAVTKAAQSTNTAFLDFVDDEYRPVVICRDGANGTTPNGTVEKGTWNFFEYDCSVQPCVVTTQTCGVDIDGDGTDDYYTCGYVGGGGAGPDAGECNWGLVAQNVNDIGEYCDWYDDYTHTCNRVLPDPINGVRFFQPWNFRDLNGDGVVDTGSFYLEHYLHTSSTFDIWFYPFTAKGTAVSQNMSVTVQ